MGRKPSSILEPLDKHALISQIEPSDGSNSQDKEVRFLDAFPTLPTDTIYSSDVFALLSAARCLFSNQCLRASALLTISL